jgi:hypothetical protein
MSSLTMFVAIGAQLTPPLAVAASEPRAIHIHAWSSGSDDMSSTSPTQDSVPTSRIG